MTTRPHAHAPRSGGRRRAAAGAIRAATYAVLVLGGLPILLPLYWLVLGSLKTHERMNASPPDWLPVDRRDYLSVEGAERRVWVLDDGRTSGTGVARVRLTADAGAAELRLPAERIEARAETVYFAEIEGVRRHVEPLAWPGADAGAPGSPDSAPTVIDVALVGTAREVEVPLTELEIVDQTTVVWSVLGVEVAVEPQSVAWPSTAAPRPAPAAGADVAAAPLVRFAGEPPPIVVAAGLLDTAPATSVEAGGSVGVRWRNRNLDARLIGRNAAAGLATVRLVPPSDGLRVPAEELRAERRTRRFAAVDGRRREVRVVRRDEERGVALVELLDEPQVARIAVGRIERAERVVHVAEILGERRVVEPLAPVADGGAVTEGASRAAWGAATGPRPASQAASDPRATHGPPVAVRVPGTLSVAAERIRTEMPLAPQWGNYASAWREQTFGLYVTNTLFVALLVVLGTVLSCGLVGYAFARLEFRGRELLFLLLLSTLMIPGQVTIIPTFVLFSKFGWIDTFKPLIVPHFLAQSAFFVFLYRQFVLTIPADLDDAARIDGCGPLRTWWLVIMPLCRPIVVTVAVFSFVGVWNDFLYPLLYINSDEKQTVALGLQNFKSAFGGVEPQLIMAASVMMIAPCAILFFAAQRAFIRGVVVSGVKG